MSAGAGRVASEPLTVDDLRELWPALPPSERMEAFAAAPRDAAEEFFLGLPAREMCELVLALPPGERRSWLRMAPPDDAADLLQSAPPAERPALLHLLDEPTREEVSGLLAYREDQAGGLMSPRYVRLRPEMSVDEAVSYLRQAAREHMETIYYVYVLDAEQRLVGVVSFRELLGASHDKRVRDVMRKDFVSVPNDMDQEDVVRLIRRERLLAVPVLDAGGRIQGIVTVDDVIDVLVEEQTEDMYKMAGIGVQERATSPMLESARRRVPWLGFNMAWSLGSAAVVSAFQPTIEKAAVLAVFMPVIAGQAGNAGIQTATIVIRSLALGDVTPRDTLRVLLREMGVGLIKGGTFGLVLGLIAWLWKGSAMLGVVAGVSLFLNIAIVAATSGVLLPMALSRLGKDPATIAGVFDTMLSDLMGNLIYLGLATALLRWLV
jgi:magnesium transporter